ncbi:MAG: alanine racemase [Euryarchaeota archaeon]|nr:alanine racemase [Euryarchaeota archaeon]
MDFKWGGYLMHIVDLPTPIILVDLKRLENNIKRAAEYAKKHRKTLWPMIKTHKSTYIAKLQRKYGSEGFLCGTIDEAETLVERGLTKTVMLAYPVADKENLRRVVNIVENGARVIIRIDNKENARFVNDTIKEYGLSLDYVIKIDSGMHRLGVPPERVVDFVKSLERYKRLNFVGIATHPGQAYAATTPEEVKKVAKEVAKTMEHALRDLENAGYSLEIVGTGSTPTFKHDVEMDVYTHLFPGNYVYYDRFQVKFMGSATFNDCALTVLATVISIPEHSSGKLAIINVGSKYLGLDRAAHGGDIVRNYGYIVEHPKAKIFALSEEIGKVDISEEPEIQLGEKINIIPNHACVVGNSTSYLVGHKGGRVEKVIEVDMRNGTRILRTLLSAFISEV